MLPLTKHHFLLLHARLYNYVLFYYFDLWTNFQFFMHTYICTYVGKIYS